MLYRHQPGHQVAPMHLLGANIVVSLQNVSITFDCHQAVYHAATLVMKQQYIAHPGLFGERFEYNGVALAQGG